LVESSGREDVHIGDYERTELRRRRADDPKIRSRLFYKIEGPR